jgi:hypothetical protein
MSKENPLPGAKSAGTGARAFGGKLPPKTSLVSPSRAPFQDRGARRATGRVTRPVGWVDLRYPLFPIPYPLSPKM